MSLDVIRALLEKSAQSVVVIDEAYIDFGGESATQLIDEYDNLISSADAIEISRFSRPEGGFAMGSKVTY